MRSSTDGLDDLGRDLLDLAGHRGRLAEGASVDPVTAEVLRGAMETVCFEMATYVSRTATTPIQGCSGGVSAGR